MDPFTFLIIGTTFVFFTIFGLFGKAIIKLQEQDIEEKERLMNVTKEW